MVAKLLKTANVVAPEAMYWSLRGWLKERAALGLLELDFVPNGDAAALARALRPGRTALVWAETPSNPTCAITDLAEAAELAHRAGARLAVDGTVATPVLTQPLSLGADLVMHSASKQLNGHGDVLAGSVGCRLADYDRLTDMLIQVGSTLGPNEAWLALRGLNTNRRNSRTKHSNPSDWKQGTSQGASNDRNWLSMRETPRSSRSRIIARTRSGRTGRAQRSPSARARLSAGLCPRHSPRSATAGTKATAATSGRATASATMPAATRARLLRPACFQAPTRRTAAPS